MKKIILTGATSMLGVATIEAALKRDIEIYAIVRGNTNRIKRLPDSSHIHIIRGDLCELTNIHELPNDCDVFYHFAWAGTQKTERDNPTIQEKNIKYTLEAVELAHRCGCRRFVGAGSQAEYGDSFDEIDLNTKLNPTTSYGAAKMAAGILSKKKCDEYNMEYIWGRVFSVYGPHDNEGTMIEYALNCWSEGIEASFSAATQMWNYLYESDAGEFFFRFGLDYVPPGFYLVAHTKSQVLREYILTMERVFGMGAKSRFAEDSIPRTAGLNVNVAKTVEIIRYLPQISFEEGITKTINAKRMDEYNTIVESGEKE